MWNVKSPVIRSSPVSLMLATVVVLNPAAAWAGQPFCLSGSYQVLGRAQANGCTTPVCVAEVTCGEELPGLNPLPKVWTVEHLKPDSVYLSTYACPAHANGMCPATLQECVSRAKDLEWKHGVTKMPKVRELPTSSYREGVAGVYRATGVIRGPGEGVCGKAICVGSFDRFNLADIDPVLKEKDPTKKTALLGALTSTRRGIACFADEIAMIGDACPSLEICANDDEVIFTGVGDPQPLKTLAQPGFNGNSGASPQKKEAGKL